jgi:hypothetical protein
MPAQAVVPGARSRTSGLDAGMTVTQFRFIGYDTIQYLSPPRPGPLGRSGRLRFGLTSGHEYQVGFLGPLFSDEGMRQEQRLASTGRSSGVASAAHRCPHSRACRRARRSPLHPPSTERGRSATATRLIKRP